MDVAESGLETEDREEVVAAMWEVASARQELAVVSKWKMQDCKNMMQYWKNTNGVTLGTARTPRPMN